MACLQVTPKLLEKSKGGVFVSNTDPSTNVIGLTGPRRFTVPLTSRSKIDPETPSPTLFATYKLLFIETSPPTKSFEFADISFATIPPVKVPPVKGTPPIISEPFDGINIRPPKDTSLPTRTLLLNDASLVPVTDNLPDVVIAPAPEIPPAFVNAVTEVNP